MDVPFRGRFEAKIDQKGRLSLPKGLIACFPAENSSVVVTNSQYKGHRNLDVYLYSEWQKLEERIRRLSPLKTEVQDFQRFYLAGGQIVEPDGNNRVLLPGPLRKYSAMKSQVVIVGMGNKLEIWAAEVWNKLYGQLADNFEETLAAVAALDEESK